MKKKKEYKEPEIELTAIDIDDVVATSSNSSSYNEAMQFEQPV